MRIAPMCGREILKGILAVGALLSIVAPVAAQSMTPMRGEIRSFTDEFAVRVTPHNPYNHRIRIEVRVYDEHFRPVAARVSPGTFLLGGRASRPVLVTVSFDGAAERRVRICTESVPFPNERTRVRAQICGRFLARRLQ